MPKKQKSKNIKQNKKIKKSNKIKKSKKYIKKSNKIKKSKKTNINMNSDENKNGFSLDSLSLEDRSILDFKKTKYFSVATPLSQYKSQSHIGELYDYKPLHDKINNLCINKIIVKEPSINKKNSKQICECIFDKNKDLSIIELENRIKQKKDIPSSHCITILDKFKKSLSKTSKISKTSKKSNA